MRFVNIDVSMTKQLTERITQNIGILHEIGNMVVEYLRPGVTTGMERPSITYHDLNDFESALTDEDGEYRLNLTEDTITPEIADLGRFFVERFQVSKWKQARLGLYS